VPDLVAARRPGRGPPRFDSGRWWWRRSRPRPAPCSRSCSPPHDRLVRLANQGVVRWSRRPLRNTGLLAHQGAVVAPIDQDHSIRVGVVGDRHVLAGEDRGAVVPEARLGLAGLLSGRCCRRSCGQENLGGAPSARGRRSGTNRRVCSPRRRRRSRPRPKEFAVALRRGPNRPHPPAACGIDRAPPPHPRPLKAKPDPPRTSRARAEDDRVGGRHRPRRGRSRGWRAKARARGRSSPITPHRGAWWWASTTRSWVVEVENTRHPRKLVKRGLGSGPETLGRAGGAGSTRGGLPRRACWRRTSRGGGPGSPTHVVTILPAVSKVHRRAVSHPRRPTSGSSHARVGRTMWLRVGLPGGPRADCSTRWAP